MSLILDALNKADRERQDSESPPGLQSNHGVFAGNQNITGLKKMAIVVVAGLVLVAAAVAYHMGKQSSSPRPATVSEPLATVNEPIKAANPQRVTEAPQLAVGKVIDTDNKTAVSAASQTAETRALLQKRRIEQQYKEAQAAKAQNIAAAPASESEKSPDKVSTLYQSAESKEAVNSKTESQTSTAQTNDSQTKESTAGDAENPSETQPVNSTPPTVGGVRDLPWSAQEKIPTLMYTEHSYTNSPNDFVTINGERKKQGQKIAGILTVESILPDGVILRYENHQFKMPAFNSWVNM